MKPMRQMRPVVETGWENTVLMRMLQETGSIEVLSARAEGRLLSQAPLAGQIPAYGATRADDLNAMQSQTPMLGMLVDSVLKFWDGGMAEQRLEAWKLDKEALMKGYGEIRDDWIGSKPDNWLAASPPFPGVPDLLNAMIAGGAEVFIITTKQRRFAEALIKHYGIDLPADHLFALEDGPKMQVLKDLVKRPEFADKQFHFVEDKLGTLKKVIAEPELDKVELYLADWGYVSERDFKIANIIDRVTKIGYDELEVLGVVDPWI